MLVQSAPSRAISINGQYLQIKRIVDITFTLLIAPLLLLIGILIALWIKLDSRGPIFFCQERVGRNGKRFRMFKFRSMYVNSDPHRHREKIIKYMNGHKLNDGASPELAYKDTDDPRITKVGHFIRKTSLDELPQFWNVLCGDMSLVGPRPPLPYEVELYSDYEMLRLAGKPGLTGPWQIYGRSRVSFNDMVAMDIAYLEHQSIWQDIKLIILTLPVMLFARGGA